ncbi:hypothetical protein DFJ77DRAFT_444451 [Powellomyces hirtus]|nr:hypothetical protein DFJ77DRAFT_444451 [Powellomyces hirtus]
MTVDGDSDDDYHKYRPRTPPIPEPYPGTQEDLRRRLAKYAITIPSSIPVPSRPAKTRPDAQPTGPRHHRRAVTPVRHAAKRATKETMSDDEALRVMLVDPRLRGQLGIRPEVNPAPARRTCPSRTEMRAASGGASSDGVAAGSAPLARPTLNSSLAIKAQLNRVKEDSFDPVMAVQNMMISDRIAVRQVQSRVTAKALNVDRDTARYKDLVPLDSDPHTHIARAVIDMPNNEKPIGHAIPRARKSVPASYLSNRPPPLVIRPEYPELDTISIPYPQTSDSPVGPSARHLSVASEELNLEDWTRWKMWRKPIQLSDFDP